MKIEHKKLFLTLTFIVAFLFLFTLFLRTIPIPVPTQSCAKQNGIDNCCTVGFNGVDTNCGIYWTSGLEQISVGNRLGFANYLLLFIMLEGGVILLKNPC